MAQTASERDQQKEDKLVQLYLQLAEKQIAKDRDSVLFYTQAALDAAQSAPAQNLAFGAIKKIAIMAAQRTGDFQLQKQGFEQLRAFSQLHQKDSLLAISLYGIAVGEHTMGEHRAALAKLEAIDQLLQKAQLSAQQIATIVLLRAEVHNALQEHDLAIQYYVEVLKLSEANALFDKKASSLNGLKQLHQDQGNLKKALNYAEQGLAASLQTQQLPRIAVAHLELGTIYFESSSQGQQDNKDYNQLAKEQFELALEKAKESQYLPVVGVAQLNMATWYQEQGDLEQGAAYLQQALMVFEEVQDQGNALRALMQLAELNQLLAERLENAEEPAYESYIQQAVLNATKAYQESELLGVVAVQVAAAQMVAALQAELGDFRTAYGYLDVYNQLRDSLLNAEKLQIIEETEAQFQNEKKQLQIELLNEEKATRQAWLYGIGMGLLVALILLGIVVWLYQQKQKVNAQLALQNELINQQKNLLQERHEEKEILLKEIHHRVKNNLQIISSLLDLQNKSIQDATASLAVEDGQSRIRSMALIHHKLYQNENLSTVNWQEYTEQLVQQILGMLTKTPPNYNIDIAPTVELDIDTAIPLGLILNELLTNACKYAFPVVEEGEIRISLQELGQGRYTLQVWDNGVGLPVGFELKKARSLGLRLVRRLSKQLFGKATYTYQKGSLFTVEFKDTLTRKSIE